MSNAENLSAPTLPNPAQSLPCDAAAHAATSVAEAMAGCGPSLEYEPDYLLLMARLAPRDDVQYGSFVGNSAAPDWPAIEREALRLLTLSQDIALLVCRCRAATRLRQADGLAQGLRQLRDVLRRWPQGVHPQAVIDGMTDLSVRANALAALADPAGLLSDIGGIVVSPGDGPPITLCDIRAAFALPRQPGLPDPAVLARRLAGGGTSAQPEPSEPIGQVAHRQPSTSLEPAGGAARQPLATLAQAACDAADIDRWAQEQLGEDAPDLQGLLQLLNPFSMALAIAPVAPPSPYPCPKPVPARVQAPALLAATTDAPHAPARTRADMRAVLADARCWFETHEPSSPVAVLLAQAENLVGKRFSQVAQSIPPDLLRQWEAAVVGGESRAPA